MKKINPVVHFEILVQDKKLMSQFYSQTFRWESKQLRQEMVDYVVVHKTETSET